MDTRLPAFDPLLALALGIALALAAAVIALIVRSRRRRQRARAQAAAEEEAAAAERARNRLWMWDLLTPREMEVAVLVAQGKRSTEVARELNISYTTVDAHLHKIYEKLNVHTRIEMARAIRELLD